MKKPHRFTLVHKETKESKPFVKYYTYPTTEDVSEWVSIDENGTKEKKVMWDVWEDMRYAAKLRLYKYFLKLQGFTPAKYEPFKNTEIGKTIPILNF